MTLTTIGQLIAERRRARQMTLNALAAAAGVGSSTLAALEAGKARELGYAKVARPCAALDLVLGARPLTLAAPVIPHRHLTDAAGRDLTKAEIEDIITCGDVSAWRELVHAARGDATGRVARRTREMAAVLGRHDEKPGPSPRCCRSSCASPRAAARSMGRTRRSPILGRSTTSTRACTNLRRSAPLETTAIELPNGRSRIPTVAEMLRIKAYLTVERNATRDYLDVAALSHHLGLRKSAVALNEMNDLYGEFTGEGGDMLTAN